MAYAERIPCPEPGVYHGVPADVYHAWDAASNSALSLMAGRSPAHARYLLDNPPAPTPAKLRGEALHLAVLEPALLHRHFVVPGPCAAELRSGDRKGQACGATGRSFVGGAWFCDKHHHGETEEPRQLLPAADFECCMAMRAAVLAHPDAGPILTAAAEREVSIVFDWPATTIRCKARLDLPVLSHAAIGDVKSTQDASEAGFNRAVERFGYYRQDPFYTTAAEAAGFPVRDFFFIAVESRPHHGVAVHQLDEDWRSIGRAEIADLLGVWKACTDTGRWPSYRVGVSTLSPPAWKRAGSYMPSPFDEDTE
jgi:hypothetical protein